MFKVIASIFFILSLIGISQRAQATTPSALLNRLEQEAVNYFWTQSNPTTGVTRDRAPNAPGSVTPDNGPGGGYDQCNISAEGYALAAYGVGADEGWIPRSQALARTQATLAHLDTTSSRIQLNGWFYQWLSYDDGDAIAYYNPGWGFGISSIDNGHLFAGIVFAKSYWNDPTVTLHANNILNRINWKWMITEGGYIPGSTTFPATYDPTSGYFSGSYPYINEGADLLLIGIGSDPTDVPPAVWNNWYRPVLSWNGYNTFYADSLYLHEMSEGYFDYQGKRDSNGWDYWVAAQQSLLMNQAYCQTLTGSYPYFGTNIWGLSVCDGPNGYIGFPYGGPWLASANGNTAGPVSFNDSGDGVIDPSATIAGVGYALVGTSGGVDDVANDAANALDDTYSDYEGEYGFYAGFQPASAWHTSDALGIDLGPLVLAVENVRDNMPHDTMSASPIVSQGMNSAGFHATNEGPVYNRPLQLIGPTVTAVSVSPSSLIGGQSCLVTVTLSAPAGVSGDVVSISSGGSTAVTVPSTVTVSMGQTSGSFDLKSSAVSASTEVTLRASFNSTYQTATLTVGLPAITYFSLSPTQVLGGAGSNGTLSMDGYAGPSGDVVKLASNTPDVVVPTSVTVTAGTSSGTFSITTKAVSAAATATLTATLGGSSKTATLMLTPATLDGVSIAPSSVIGGQSFAVMVTLSSPAGSTGDAVSISAGGSAAVTAPSTVTVPAGKTSGSFDMKSNPVSALTVVTVKASFNGVSHTATLTVGLPSITSFTLSPAQVVGGASSTATLSIDGYAGPSGDVLKLASNNPDVVVPTSVTIAAGKSSGTFTITTKKVAATTHVSITATLGNSTVSRTLTLTP